MFGHVYLFYCNDVWLNRPGRWILVASLRCMWILNLGLQPPPICTMAEDVCFFETWTNVCIVLTLVHLFYSILVTGLYVYIYTPLTSYLQYLSYFRDMCFINKPCNCLLITRGASDELVSLEGVPAILNVVHLHQNAHCTKTCICVVWYRAFFFGDLLFFCCIHCIKLP